MFIKTSQLSDFDRSLAWFRYELSSLRAIDVVKLAEILSDAKLSPTSDLTECVERAQHLTRIVKG